MAKRITRAAVKSTLKSGIEESIKKAFGANHRIHIKDAGPSWVNSPRPRPRPKSTLPQGGRPEPIPNPVVSKEITISVKRTK